MKRFLYIASLMLLSGCNNSQHNPKLTIGFVGDMMLGRLVNQQIKKTGCSNIWGDTLPLLQRNDFNVGNLETTLTRSKQTVPKVFNFKSDPANVCTLQEGNFKVVNLANNHGLDFSTEGLLETITVLDTAGIQHVGAGKNREAANQPVIIKKDNVAFGIIGYTDNEPSWIAGKDKPGTNYIRVGNIAQVQKDIASLRPRVDVLIITLHWGPNMRQRPTQEFIEFAHAMIEAGADIIHGHSAHVLQGVERYRNKIIMYDTGDFIDDYAVDPRLHNNHSCLFQTTIEDKKLTKLQLIPVLITDMQVNLARGDEADDIMATMRKLSSELGTVVDENGIINLT